MSSLVETLMAAAIAANAGGVGVVSVAWSRESRARRAKAQAEADVAVKQAAALDAIRRSNDEMGRKMASGATFQEAFRAAASVPCPDPECRCKKRKSDAEG